MLPLSGLDICAVEFLTDNNLVLIINLWADMCCRSPGTLQCKRALSAPVSTIKVETKPSSDHALYTPRSLGSCTIQLFFYQYTSIILCGIKAFKVRNDLGTRRPCQAPSKRDCPFQLAINEKSLFSIRTAENTFQQFGCARPVSCLAASPNP